MLENICEDAKLSKTIVGNTALKGRGVFAQKSLVKGELIERSPVIVIPAEQREFLDKTALELYYFAWEKDAAAIGLGLTSIYNHSYHPNALYVKKFDERVLEIFVWRDIVAGEEITVNYNENPEDQTPIWFDTVE